MAISVAIVEDNPEVRRNLSRYIGGAPGFRCACACASAEEALRVIPQSPPDVVLMDIQLPRMSGITCTASLKKTLPSVPVMMLTVYEDTDAIFNALKAGASGYLLKRSDPAQVLEALTELHHGGAPMTGEIARKVIDSFHRTRTATAPQDKLTAREFLLYLGRLKGLSGAALKSRVDHLLQLVNLHGAAGRRLGGFSGGMVTKRGPSSM